MLCTECQKIFKTPFELRENQWSKSWFAPYHRRAPWSNFKKLSTICYICRQCKIAISREFPTLSDECECSLNSGLSVDDRKGGSDDASLSIRIEPQGSTGSLGYAHVLIALVRSTAEGLSSTEKNSSIDFAQSCLTNCVTNHSECRIGKAGSPWHPTRLIEIRNNDNPLDPDTTISVRLVTTEEHQLTGPYCSLSHCWGKAKLFQLLKSNIQHLHKAIDLSLLPKTFVDAMQFALSLNVHYIWIDTLCIIQDSPDDWRYEASKMYQVYLYAYLNIAATKAADATQGLFVQQDLPIPTTTVDLEYGPRPGTFHLITQKYWKETVDEAVLNRRAWVLQERLLSTRTLHFTSEQLIWDCCETVHLQTFRLELDESGRRFIGPNGPKRNQNILSIQEKDAENGDKWLDVVHSYSRSLLSYEKDKLFALSGLVEHFGRVLRDSYCAGMWRKSMLFHLTWYPQHTVSATSAMRTKRAPSWSWLAYNGPVSIPSFAELDDPGYERVRMAEILDVSVAQVLSDDGDIYEGYLDLRTTLTPLFRDETDVLTLARPVLTPFKPEETHVRWSSEYDPTSTSASDLFFYIPIWCLLVHARNPKFKDACEMHGLIVREKQKDPLAYERSAHACLSTRLTEPFEGPKSYHQAIMGAEPHSGDGNDAENHSLYESTVRLF